MAARRDTRFIAVPLTTALQRLARDDVTAFVLVSMADDEFVDFKELEDTLANWPDREGRVLFSIRTGLPDNEAVRFIDAEPVCTPVLFQQSDLVRLAFENLARMTGFAGALVETWFEPKQRSWDRIARDFLESAPTDASADESPNVGNLVEVYPVHTALSRFENLGADYVLRFVPPVHELVPRAAELSSFIDRQLHALDPQRAGKITCMVSASERGAATEAGFDLLLGNRFWSNELGFKLAGWRQI
jgi:hypothetical protein